MTSGHLQTHTYKKLTIKHNKPSLGLKVRSYTKRLFCQNQIAFENPARTLQKQREAHALQIRSYLFQRDQSYSFSVHGKTTCKQIQYCRTNFPQAKVNAYIHTDIRVYNLHIYIYRFAHKGLRRRRQVTHQ